MQDGNSNRSCARRAGSKFHRLHYCQTAGPNHSGSNSCSRLCSSLHACGFARVFSFPVAGVRRGTKNSTAWRSIPFIPDLFLNGTHFAFASTCAARELCSHRICCGRNRNGVPIIRCDTVHLNSEASWSGSSLSGKLIHKEE